MQRSRLISTGALFLVLGTLVPAYAQEPNHNNNGPATPPPIWLKQPAGKGHQGPPGPQAQPQRPQQGPPSHRQQGPPKRQGRPQAIWQEHRAQSWRSEHHSWQERGGYNGYRIPEQRFRSRFGPRHAFRIHRYPMSMMGGFINFQFGGFGFSILDPLPEYWSDSWYENDDVYIDDAGDGYYLRNRRHPEDHIAISVTVR